MAWLPGIAKRMGLEGTARIVILGASPKDAEGWITATPWSTLKGVRRNPASAGCPSLAPGDVRIPGAQSNAVVYPALCAPMAAPSAVPATALLVNALLGGREDALLAARLRMETGLAYSFESRVIPDIDGHATLWYLHFSTAAGKVNQAIAEVRAVLEKAATGGIPADRMASFREWLAQQRVDRAKDGFAWVMSLLSSGLAPEQEAVAIRATTDAEIHALLRAWWLSPRLTITATMPASGPQAGPRSTPVIENFRKQRQGSASSAVGSRKRAASCSTTSTGGQCGHRHSPRRITAGSARIARRAGP